MDTVLSYLATGRDLLLVITGFSLIIVLHELGHFLAARWAGVRVLAFALGFGPAMVSFRKGMGVRRGSSENEYLTLKERDPMAALAISPTEYRWNILPLGGYVRMLGQDDADPSARSDERDSYNEAPTWKRMIIISAGVIMNIITAAILFVIVFRVGLPTEAPVIGEIRPSSPASVATLVSGSLGEGATAEAKIGLRPGDELVSIDGSPMFSFTDASVALAMSSPGSSVKIEVRRPGVEGVLEYSVEPRMDPMSRMLAIGIGPARTARLFDAPTEEGRKAFMAAMNLDGAGELEPGDRIVGLAGGGPGGREFRTSSDVNQAFAMAGEGSDAGATLRFVVERGAAGDAGAVVGAGGTGVRRVEVGLPARPAFQAALFAPSEKSQFPEEHLLGLAPPMAVLNVVEGGKAAGLQPGDVFAVVGGLQWPTAQAARLEIGKHAGREIEITVWRAKAAPKASEGAALAAERELVTLKGVKVSKEGAIGFGIDTNLAQREAMVASWPSAPMVLPGQAPGVSKVLATPSGATMGVAPGSRIVSVNGQPVVTMADVWKAIRAAAKQAPEGDDLTVSVGHQRVLANASSQAPLEVTSWTIRGRVEAPVASAGPTEVQQLRALKWTGPLDDGVYQPLMTELHADTIPGAMAMGLRQTQTAMTQTYLTFARLFQGSIKVEHLRGPVGIAHVGTLLAGRGFIWLIFFMAIISVNLAVVNFLPLPIVDGGHFIFLLYEQFTGRPVSVAVQNVATIAGLLMIASMFLLVTYHDVVRLIVG